MICIYLPRVSSDSAKAWALELAKEFEHNDAFEGVMKASRTREESSLGLLIDSTRAYRKGAAIARDQAEQEAKEAKWREEKRLELAASNTTAAEDRVLNRVRWSILYALADGSLKKPSHTTWATWFYDEVTHRLESLGGGPPEDLPEFSSRDDVSGAHVDERDPYLTGDTPF